MQSSLMTEARVPTMLAQDLPLLSFFIFCDEITTEDHQPPAPLWQVVDINSDGIRAKRNGTKQYRNINPEAAVIQVDL